VGQPAQGNPTEEDDQGTELAYFYGLGALIIFLGGIALGRLSIRSARDVRHAQRTAMTTTEPVASDDVTEIRPADEEPQPRRRTLGELMKDGDGQA